MKNKNQNKIILPFICIILLLQKISCSYFHKNDEINIKINDILQDSFKNNNINIKNLKDILSKITYDMNDIFEQGIEVGDIIIDDIFGQIPEEKTLECFEHFHSLMREYKNNINSVYNILESDINKKIPSYCKSGYNEMYKFLNEAILNHKPKNYKFTMKFEIKDEINDIKINRDKNNVIYINNNDKKKNKSYDDELEQYYKNSRKDCVEYGFKSPKEEIIVCTKYE